MQVGSGSLSDGVCESIIGGDWLAQGHSFLEGVDSLSLRMICSQDLPCELRLELERTQPERLRSKWRHPKSSFSGMCTAPVPHWKEYSPYKGFGGVLFFGVFFFVLFSFVLFFLSLYPQVSFKFDSNFFFFKYPVFFL